MANQVPLSISTPTTIEMSEDGTGGGPSHPLSLPSRSDILHSPPHLREMPPPYYTGRLPPCTWGVKSQFATWEVDHARFELKRTLGKGSYGAVVEALDHLTGQRVAIKRVDNVFDVFENAKRIYREVHILRRMEHANIIKIVHIEAPRDLGSFNTLYMVFECMDTDFQKLTKDETQDLTIQHVRHFLYQTLLGMKYIHSARILHRDIKPANLLLTESCDLKVCDFGLARSMDLEVEQDDPEDVDREHIGMVSPPEVSMSDIGTPAGPAAAPRGQAPAQIASRQMTRHVVTRWYRAPELPLYNDGIYTSAVDCWAVGCVFAEMLGMLDSGVGLNYDRKALFPGGSCFPMSRDRSEGARKDEKKKKDQLAVILDVLGAPTDDEMRRLRTEDARQYIKSLHRHGQPKEDLSRRYPTAGPEAIDLLFRFLRIIPEDRISIADAISHPFLQSVRQPHLEIVRTQGAIHVRKATPATIRDLFIEEIRAFNAHIPDYWAEIVAYAHAARAGLV